MWPFKKRPPEFKTTAEEFAEISERTVLLRILTRDGLVQDKTAFEHAVAENTQQFNEALERVVQVAQKRPQEWLELVTDRAISLQDDQELLGRRVHKVSNGICGIDTMSESDAAELLSKLMSNVVQSHLTTWKVMYGSGTLPVRLTRSYYDS